MAVSNNSLKVVQYIYTKSVNDIICAIAPYKNSMIGIDALVYAYTVYYCLHNDCNYFGSSKEGILSVPKPQQAMQKEC
ncbi:MAG TPA: hypothetical protein PKJ69_06020 [Spirochaetota bacterium]|nr:hypothetical protein [Spirochaetota bacterium]